MPDVKEEKKLKKWQKWVLGILFFVLLPLGIVALVAYLAFFNKPIIPISHPEIDKEIAKEKEVIAKKEEEIKLIDETIKDKKEELAKDEAALKETKDRIDEKASGTISIDRIPTGISTGDIDRIVADSTSSAMDDIRNASKGLGN
jgi:anionic cell wall polymer biosynthesis LytR-Cps2A-Psr (LCP) family protein